MELSLIPQPKSVAFAVGLASDGVTRYVDSALPADGCRLGSTEGGIASPREVNRALSGRNTPRLSCGVSFLREFPA